MVIARNIDEFLALKPKGHFRISSHAGRMLITVNRPDDLEEVILCVSPGHANQVRQRLTDEGLTGLVEGSR